MSGLPPKPEFDSRDDEKQTSPRRSERSDPDHRASSSRVPLPLADSYVAPVGDTYVPRHDERPRRPSPPPRLWREPPRRSPPPRRDERRPRDEQIDRRRDYPSRSRDYSRGGPRDRDRRRERDYDNRDRHYPRRSPSPHTRDRRWNSRGSPSPPRRSTYDYRRRSPAYHSRRSASPRYRRPSPGRRVDGRSSPRRPPPRDEDREERAGHRHSRNHSRTRSHTPRPSAPQDEVSNAQPTSEVPAPAEGVKTPPKPSPAHSQKLFNQQTEPSETRLGGFSLPTGGAGSIVDTDVVMINVQPPTQPKAFTVNTAALPTQPKSFNRPPPTGPRSALTPGQNHPPHQPPTSEQAPLQEPSPAVADSPVEGKPEIQLPKIEPFELLTKEITGAFVSLENTIEQLLRKSYTMRTEYDETLKGIRKAVHEQEMAEIELAPARMRREVADSQLEKARLGLLGIDYDGISGLVISE